MFDSRNTSQPVLARTYASMARLPFWPQTRTELSNVAHYGPSDFDLTTAGMRQGIQGTTKVMNGTLQFCEQLADLLWNSLCG